MEAVNFSFRKIGIMIFFIILSCGIINAQEKPATSQPEKTKITTVKATKPKQVKASRPALSQTKGARPPTIIRPSGSGIPKGTGNPGGAVGPGRR